MKPKTSLLLLALAALAMSAQADPLWTTTDNKNYLSADGAWQVTGGGSGGIKMMNRNAYSAAAAIGWVMDLGPLGEEFPNLAWLSKLQANADWPRTGREGLKKLVLPSQCATILSKALATSSGQGAFSGLQELVGTNVTVFSNDSLQGCSNLVSITLSPNIAELPGPTNPDSQHLLSGMPNLVHFSPSTFSSSFTSIGAGFFMKCALTNYFDFSASAITTIPKQCFDTNAIAGATFPASLATIEERAFRELRHSATFRFLGNVPTFGGNAGNTAPFWYSGQSNQPGRRHTFIVDAETYPNWIANADPSNPTFIPLADIPTCSNERVRNNFHATDADFPGKRTLGVTLLGSGENRWNWLVQAGEDIEAQTIYLMFE